MPKKPTSTRKTASKPRAKRGSARVENRDGTLYMSCTVDGKRHRFSLRLPYHAGTAYDAEKIAKQIELDILNKVFDPTYQRYRGQPDIEPEPVSKTSTIVLWQKWIDHRRSKKVAEQTLNSRYRTIGTHLKTFGRNVTTEADALKLLDQMSKSQGYETHKRSLRMLQSFGFWALKRGHIEVDPFADLEPEPQPELDSAEEPPLKTPFTEDEIHRIRQGFRTHPQYLCYSDFVSACFGLGLRISEAIGLQWHRVDFEKSTIKIIDSLGRGSQGESRGSARVRRTRKNKVHTEITLIPQLLAVLQGRYSRDQNPEDLIFTVDGSPIDDQKFRRAWTKVLKLAGVDYRPPKNMRHTMASHAVNEGQSLPDVATMLGHKNLRMVTTVYVKSVNPPTPPTMGL